MKAQPPVSVPRHRRSKCGQAVVLLQRPKLRIKS